MTLEMPEAIVIADTSCLIVLTKVNALPVLESLYGQIYITEEVATEFGESLPEWIKVEKVKDKRYYQILSAMLDPGEASSIALALEMKNVLLIVDEFKGRREARRLGIEITGTLGVLVKAKQKGLIKELRPMLNQLNLAGFWISEVIAKEMLKQAGEG
jgi:predicted nucleic acid-binding protein